MQYPPLRRYTLLIMALGSSKSSQNDTDLVFLSVRSKDKDGTKVKPHFSVGRRNAEGKIDTVESDDSEVSGNLTRLEIKEKDFNGSITKLVLLYLKDQQAGETYVLSLNFRNSTRGLFNRLFNLETTDNLTIGVYENKRGYETFYMRQGQERVEWKYKLEDLPEPEPKTINGNRINDYYEVDRFFEENLVEVATRLGVAPRAKAAAASADVASDTTPAPQAAEPAAAPLPEITAPAKPAPRTVARKPAAPVAPAADAGKIVLPF